MNKKKTPLTTKSLLTLAEPTSTVTTEEPTPSKPLSPRTRDSPWSTAQSSKTEPPRRPTENQNLPQEPLTSPPWTKKMLSSRKSSPLLLKSTMPLEAWCTRPDRLLLKPSRVVRKSSSRLRPPPLASWALISGVSNHLLNRVSPTDMLRSSTLLLWLLRELPLLPTLTWSILSLESSMILRRTLRHHSPLKEKLKDKEVKPSPPSEVESKEKSPNSTPESPTSEENALTSNSPSPLMKKTLPVLKVPLLMLLPSEPIGKLPAVLKITLINSRITNSPPRSPPVVMLSTLWKTRESY